MYQYRPEHIDFIESIQHVDFSKAILNLLQENTSENIEIKQHPHCIELSNSEICIAIVIFVGFETQELNVLKFHHNFHIITFYSIIPQMLEFKNLKIKYIDTQILTKEIINISPDFFARLLRGVSNLEK